MEVVNRTKVGAHNQLESTTVLCSACGRSSSQNEGIGARNGGRASQNAVKSRASQGNACRQSARGLSPSHSQSVPSHRQASNVSLADRGVWQSGGLPNQSISHCFYP